MAKGMIHIDVLDASGNRVAPQPITTAMQASVTRELSGTGTISLSFPAEDYYAAKYLTNERRVNIYVWDDDTKAGKRLLGSGIIRNVAFSENAGSQVLVVTGPDILDELKRVNTWIAWTQDAQNVEDIFDDLVALDANWTSDSSGIASLSLDPLSMRLDGASALGGLQSLVKQQGIHFRLGEGREVEGGAFGDASGIRILQAGSQVAQELYENDTVALIERLVWNYQSEGVVNKIVPLGPGDFEAALSLKDSTRTSPYTIQSMSVNGETLYYLEDSTSVSAYGTIEKMVRASGIAALSNTEADLENAANALYDIAANYLSRHAVIQEVYTVTIRNITQNLKPGQKVNLRYKGYAVDEDWNPKKWVDLNDDYWILRTTERFDLSGRVVDLQLSNVDLPAMDGASQIVGELDDIRTQNVVVKPYLSKDTITGASDTVSSSRPVTVKFVLGDYTARVNQAILRLWERPPVGSATGVISMVVKFDGNTLPGGPWTDTGAGLNLEWDITSYIDEIGFQGTYDVLISCGSNGGLISCQIELRETIQSIRLV